MHNTEMNMEGAQDAPTTHAEPQADNVASVRLDLWAIAHISGYEQEYELERKLEGRQS